MPVVPDRSIRHKWIELGQKYGPPENRRRSSSRWPFCELCGAMQNGNNLYDACKEAIERKANGT